MIDWRPTVSMKMTHRPNLSPDPASLQPDTANGSAAILDSVLSRAPRMCGLFLTQQCKLRFVGPVLRKRNRPVGFGCSRTLAIPATFDGIPDVSSATSGSRDLNSNLEDIAAERIDLANRVRDRAGALSFEKFRHYLGGNLFLAEALSRRLDLNAAPKIAEGLCSRL